MLVLENYKPPSLAKFDGHNELYEHVASTNTQMDIIGAPGSLKCKLLYGTFRDITLRWYIGFPRPYVIRYQDLVKKLVNLFATRKRKKMTSTSLFNIHQGPSNSFSQIKTKKFVFTHSKSELLCIEPHMVLSDSLKNLDNFFD